MAEKKLANGICLDCIWMKHSKYDWYVGRCMHDLHSINNIRNHDCCNSYDSYENEYYDDYDGDDSDVDI